MTITVNEATKTTRTETIKYMGRKTKASKFLIEKSFDSTHTFAMAEVTVNGKTRTMEVRRTFHEDGWEVSGIATKYRTGEKVWNGTATRWDKSGNVTISAGLDNHARFNTCQSVIGFYDEYEARQSQHVGA